jgi:protein-S-isoprenylcysteine O-methyltransferase Ste14
MDDMFWKAAYLIIFLIWFGIRGYYRQKALEQNVKENVRPGFESVLVLLNMIGMTVLPLVAVTTPFLDAFLFPVPEPVRFVALIIFALDIWLFVLAHRDLGRNWSMILEIKEGHSLVKSGIYRRIRHPMYAHFWIWVIAQGFLLANGLVLVFGIISWGLLYFLRVPKEEEMMIAEFGDEYREYMRVTGRVIPKFVKN